MVLSVELGRLVMIREVVVPVGEDRYYQNQELFSVQ